MPRLAPSAKIERRSVREKINSSVDTYIAMDTLMTTAVLSKQPWRHNAMKTIKAEWIA